jgi:hypothetical protein
VADVTKSDKMRGFYPPDLFATICLPAMERNMYLSSINDVLPDEFYPQGRFANIVTSDGRRMDEALRNHPCAPAFREKERVGKYYKGAEVKQFYFYLERACSEFVKMKSLRSDLSMKLNVVEAYAKSPGNLDVAPFLNAIDDLRRVAVDLGDLQGEA